MKPSVLWQRLRRTLAATRGMIGGAALLFTAGIVVGYFVPTLGDPFLAALRSAAKELAGRGLAEIALFIFVRNATAAALSIVGGVLFGILPAVAAVGNGLLFGAVVDLAPGEVWKILPHGVFELPAMFTAWGLGLWVGQWPSGPGRLQRLGQRLGSGLFTFLVLIVPLLALASLIEAFLAVQLFSP